MAESLVLGAFVLNLLKPGEEFVASKSGLCQFCSPRVLRFRPLSAKLSMQPVDENWNATS